MESDSLKEAVAGARRRSQSPSLVTIALSELGGAQRPVDTEEIAVKAHELAPTASRGDYSRAHKPGIGTRGSR